MSKKSFLSSCIIVHFRSYELPSSDLTLSMVFLDRDYHSKSLLIFIVNPIQETGMEKKE